MAVLLSLFLILHLLAGLALPYRRGAKPYFFMLIENAGADLERRLNRENRPQSARFIRGVVVAAAMGGGAFAAGYVVHRLAQMPYGWAAQLMFLSLCINFMAPLKTVRRVMRHLGQGELQQAVSVVQPYVKEPLEKADVHTVIRRTVEFIALSLNRFLMAPAFWFLAAGPAGMAACVAYSALQQAFGPSDPRRRYFSKCVRGIDALLNVIPAFATAFLLAAGALFVSRSSPWRAIVTMFSQSGRYHSIYAGLPVAAMAGGLGVTLGGAVRYSPDYTEERAWIGPPDSSAKVTLEDLSRAALLQYVFFICVIGALSGVVIIYP